jgi:peptidoglycan LD-endopeptidase LytH
MNTQRIHFSWHPTVGMKKTVTILAAATLIILIGSVAGITEAIGDRLLLYVRVAQLYAKEPPATIAMPLPGVSTKQIANTWHAARGDRRLHEGQDIFAPRGTAIYSAAPGYVYNIGENNLGGQTVSVIGAGGRVYYYAHLDSYADSLEEGDYVTPQTILGSVGTTGNAQGTPPHLHFGVYTSNGAINPLPLLADRQQTANSKRRTARKVVRQ